MKKSRHTDLNSVPYMVEAAQGGSFSAAARALGVPPSLVSRKIARLEQQVGARLFQRTTRSLTLTDAGQAFLEHARSALQSFSQAQEALQESKGQLRGRVRLSAPAGTAEALWSSLSRFLTENPGIGIELEVTDRYVDLIQERFDLAIRSGPEHRSDKLVGRRLLDSDRGLFASPNYLQLHGTPRTTTDLAKHACVILGSRADRVTWHLHIGKRIHNVIVQGRVAVNEARLAAECAVAGFGIGFLPVAVCARHVDEGKLQRVLRSASAGPTGLWLVYPDRHLPASSRALAEFLVKDLPTSLALRAR